MTARPTAAALTLAVVVAVTTCMLHAADEHAVGPGCVATLSVVSAAAALLASAIAVADPVLVLVQPR